MSRATNLHLIDRNSGELIPVVAEYDIDAEGVEVQSVLIGAVDIMNSLNEQEINRIAGQIARQLIEQYADIRTEQRLQAAEAWREFP